MDFMFLGPKEVAGHTLACMVVREAETRMTMAAAVLYNTTGTYISERIVAFLHETGCLHGDIIVRSDQEPAVMSITEEVGKIWAQRGGGRFVVENSPVGSSQSNGVAERKPFSLYRVRVLKLALEKTLGHPDPASALGDSLGGRVRGVPLEPLRSGPRREDRARTLERQEGENAWD